MKETLKLDAVIIGGGIAGLWLLNRLRNEGFNVWLFEQNQLGAGQTIASQGMIHGGIKYALGGNLTKASNTIAEMPAHWKRCLAGEGDVDLRGCNLLSQNYYMWPRSSLLSRFNAFLGSKALEARVTNLSSKDFPPFFSEMIDGPLYKLNDIVLDIPSLLNKLAANQQDCIFKIDWANSKLDKDDAGYIRSLQLPGNIEIQAKRYIFSCGAGNEALMNTLGLKAFAMQRRPLRMVMVKHHIPDPVYVHCISGKLTTTPELTITSHLAADGKPVWYLGGELAERGASMSASSLIDLARDKLNELFPWCDFLKAKWFTLKIDRAEERQENKNRPDDISIINLENIMMCWPTKLTLAPNLANTVLQQFAESAIVPGTETMPAIPDYFERPDVAATPWEKL